MRKLILVLLLAALAVVPSLAQEENSPPQVGLRPDAPQYALHGPYWVGTRDFKIEDADRPLSLTVWYPALNSNDIPEEIAYTDIIIKWDAGLPEDLTPTTEGLALQDAPLDRTGTPYPLVILSPGYGEFRSRYAFLAEHLASYGFVVMIPDHVEFWTPDVPDLWKDTIYRPQDIQRVITFAETLNGSSEFSGLMDMEWISVLGHSYGGYTSLAMGGARLNLDEFRARCAELPSDDVWQPTCRLLLDHQNEMATLNGLEFAPKEMWPSWYDPRIKAVATFAGDSYPFGTSGLTEIKIPLLAIGGSADMLTPPDWGIYPAYENASSSQKALVVLENADHFIFNATCNDTQWLVDTGWSFFCLENVWDMDRAHDLINHFTTAFLLDVLKGDAEAHALLAPDAVQFPGITYEAQGF